MPTLGYGNASSGKASIDGVNLGTITMPIDPNLWTDTRRLDERIDWVTGAPGSDHRWGELNGAYMSTRGLGGGAIKLIDNHIMSIKGYVKANGGNGKNVRDIYFDGSSGTGDEDRYVDKHRIYNYPQKYQEISNLLRSPYLPIYTLPAPFPSGISPNPANSPYRYAGGGGGGGGSIFLGAGILRVKKDAEAILQARGGNGGATNAGAGGGGLIYAQHNNFEYWDEWNGVNTDDNTQRSVYSVEKGYGGYDDCGSATHSISRGSQFNGAPLGNRDGETVQWAAPTGVPTR